MPTHELRRSGKPPVVFDGELVSQSTTHAGASDRRFELGAYLRTTLGPPRYVVSVAYLPPAIRSRETPQHWVLLANTAADIGPALSAWREATPIGNLLTQFPPAKQFEAKKAHLVTRLDSELSAAIADLLSRIPGTELRL